MIRMCFQQVGLCGPEVTCERHHQLFPDRINGRVGHLGKQLLEIVKEPVGPFRDYRGRSIIAH